jgi:hypothetical protein
MARRRHQRGQLIDGGDCWLARWREDSTDEGTDAAKRIRKKAVLASKSECPTREMAQRKLDELLERVNRKPLAGLPPDLRTVDVVLCDPCRQRLIAALRANAN